MLYAIAESALVVYAAIGSILTLTSLWILGKAKETLRGAENLLDQTQIGYGFSEENIEFAGTDFDSLIGECVCCGESGRMYAKLHALDGTSEAIVMCRYCWDLSEEYEKQ